MMKSHNRVFLLSRCTLLPVVQLLLVALQTTCTTNAFSSSSPQLHRWGRRSISHSHGHPHVLSFPTTKPITATRYSGTKSSSQLPAMRSAAAAAAAASSQHHQRVPGSMVLAGKLTSTLSKLMIGPKSAKAIWAAVQHTFHVGDLLLIALLGWGTVPMAKLVYARFYPTASVQHENASPELQTALFQKTKLYQLADICAQVSKVAALVYVTDLLAVALMSLGIHFPHDRNVSSLVAKIAYAIWCACKLSRVKQRMIMRAVRVRSPEQLGKNSIYDKLINVLILGSTSLWILDILSVETGRAIGSIFALGSVGTLIFSLASKDVATQLVSGLALSASGRFYEGEEIEIGDGTRGIVTKVGWMYTEIRGGDEIISKIPNAQIANQRVKNISRIRMSQVLANLCISYADIKKIPTFITDIQEEVIRSCPRLITDTRAFRVHWREFQRDHLTITVDAHFALPPTGTVYWDNRQAVYLAIARAADRNNITFAMPTVEIKSGQSIDSAIQESAFVQDALFGTNAMNGSNSADGSTSASTDAGGSSGSAIQVNGGTS